jgi:hypothetical protein
MEHIITTSTENDFQADLVTPAGGGKQAVQLHKKCAILSIIKCHYVNYVASNDSMMVNTEWGRYRKSRPWVISKHSNIHELVWRLNKTKQNKKH